MKSQRLEIINTIATIDYFLKDNQYKTAGLVDDFTSSAKNYFSSKIGNENPTKDFINIIGPGAVSIFFNRINHPIIGLLLGALASYFKIDFSSILSSIYNYIKSKASSGAKFTSDEIKDFIYKTMGINKSASLSYKDIPAIKLSLAASNIPSPKTPNVLANLLSIFFAIGLTSAGLMVATDAIHHVTDSKQEAPAVQQKVFPLNRSYNERLRNNGWSIALENNPSNIESLLLSFAKMVYSNLEDKDSYIVSSSKFKNLFRELFFYNKNSQGSSVISIPSKYKSEKQLVDYFIDDVASKFKS